MKRLKRQYRFPLILLSPCQTIYSRKRTSMNANRVLLIGYVGKDLSATKLETGSKRVGIRIATHYSHKTPGGEKIDHTVWHDIVAWDSTAEYAERSFVKGSKIMVDGSIEYRTFPDKSGHIRYITQIKAHSLMNLDR